MSRSPPEWLQHSRRPLRVFTVLFSFFLSHQPLPKFGLWMFQQTAAFYTTTTPNTSLSLSLSSFHPFSSSSSFFLPSFSPPLTKRVPWSNRVEITCADAITRTTRWTAQSAVRVCRKERKRESERLSKRSFLSSSSCSFFSSLCTCIDQLKRKEEEKEKVLSYKDDDDDDLDYSSAKCQTGFLSLSLSFHLSIRCLVIALPCLAFTYQCARFLIWISTFAYFPP